LMAPRGSDLQGLVHGRPVTDLGPLQDLDGYLRANCAEKTSRISRRLAASAWPQVQQGGGVTEHELAGVPPCALGPPRLCAVGSRRRSRRHRPCWVVGPRAYAADDRARGWARGTDWCQLGSAAALRPRGRVDAQVGTGDEHVDAVRVIGDRRQPKNGLIVTAGVPPGLGEPAMSWGAAHPPGLRHWTVYRFRSVRTKNASIESHPVDHSNARRDLAVLRDLEGRQPSPLLLGPPR
jgi:hypothetical protein